MHPRIRTIKPETHTDELLWDLEQTTGLPIFRAFTGLWNMADREGLFEWRPRALKAYILPYWDGDFETCLDKLWEAGRLVKYTHDGKVFGLVKNFPKHQAINGREARSELPDPERGDILPLPCHVDDAILTRASRVTGMHVGNRTEPNRTEQNTHLRSVRAGEGARTPSERPKEPDSVSEETQPIAATESDSDEVSHVRLPLPPDASETTAAAKINGKKSTRGRHLCPTDWEPDQKLRDYALSRNLNPDDVAEAMRDWSASGGHMKLDWAATFRTFCRREVSNVGGKPMTEQDRAHVSRERKVLESRRLDVMEDEYADAYEAIRRADEAERLAGGWR